MSNLNHTWTKTANLQKLVETYEPHDRFTPISNDAFTTLMNEALTNLYKNTHDCADALGVSTGTVRKWMDCGTSVKINRVSARNIILADAITTLEGSKKPALTPAL
jgi:hypothetical protein